MKKLAVAIGCVVLCACGTNVAQKVKYDFGIGEKPEGYAPTSDRVMAKLDDVAKTEMKRLNIEARRGEVKFQEQGPLRGKYYQETKKYEDYHPIDVRAVSRGSKGERGYVGFIEYTYRVYQSERKASRVEAAAAAADISTEVHDRETYRYRFSGGGVWDGAKGELTRK